MTENEFQLKKDEAEQKQIQREYRRVLFEMNHPILSKLKLPSTSKLFTILVICIMLEIIIFSEWFMANTGDASALYVLIGIGATMSTTLWGYFIKSKAENTVGGIKYETIIQELNNKENSEDETFG